MEVMLQVCREMGGYYADPMKSGWCTLGPKGFKELCLIGEGEPERPTRPSSCLHSPPSMA
jgi:hypothetical protein